MSIMLSLLIFCNGSPTQGILYLRVGERKCWLSFGARQQRGEEIQLLIFQNLHQPQVATHYKTIHMILHHVRTSLSISTPILFPFRLYLHVSTSDFSQSMVKLSIQIPLVRKFAWNGVVNDHRRLLSLSPPRNKRYECLFLLHIETQVRMKESWTISSPLIFGSVFPPK